jgi:hypothetical protein
MGVTEVSKLANTRGCILQMVDCGGVLLYWIENAIFVSKPFDRLEELVDLILCLPICSQETSQKEAIALPQSTFGNCVLVNA